VFRASQQILSDLHGVDMNQTTHVSTGIENQSELMAGAIHHLRNAMETGLRGHARSRALFTCLAQDEALGSRCVKPTP
jgi:hypothetical protein